MNKRTSNLQRTPAPKRALTNTQVTEDEFNAVIALLDEGDYDEAHEHALEIERHFPTDFTAHFLVMRTSIAADDSMALERVAYKLTRARPDDNQFALTLAAAYLANERYALGLRTLEAFLRKHPSAKEGVSVRKQIDQVRALVSELMPQTGLNDPLDLAIFEEADSLISMGDHGAARRLLSLLFSRIPTFISAANAIMTSYMSEGDHKLAVEWGTKSLRVDPEDYQALGCLALCNRLLGNRDVAYSLGQRIKSSASTSWQKRIVMATALLFVGDYEGVLTAQQSGAASQETSHMQAKICHFAATAASKLGNDKLARELWKSAKRLDPALPLVDENLADLDRPVGKRFGAAAIRRGEVTPERVAVAIINALEQCDGLSPDAAGRLFRKVIRQHPAIVQIASMAYELGDLSSVTSMLDITELSGDESLVQEARSFALGQRGSDGLRTRALSIVRQCDPPEDVNAPVRFWLLGSWRNVAFNDLANQLDDAEPKTRNPETQSLFAEIEQEIQKLEAPTLDELNKIAGEIMNRRNSAAREDFCGLSPELMMRLLHHPFDSPNVVELRAKLDIDPDCEMTRIFIALVNRLKNPGAVATATGNLPRALVREIATELMTDEKVRLLGWPDRIASETEYRDLNVVRIISKECGMIRKYKGRFLATKKCTELMAASGLKEIYPQLLTSYIAKLNWDYRTRMPAIPFIQTSAFYTLYLLHTFGDTWRPAEYYEDAMIKAFPRVVAQIPDMTYSTGEKYFKDQFSHLCLSKFCVFTGLAEAQERQSDLRIAIKSLMKTPLFDDAIVFHC